MDVSTVQLLTLAVESLSKGTITIEDALLVWKHIAVHIGQQLFNRKGVKLPSIGTLSLSAAGNVVFLVAKEITQCNIKYTSPVGGAASQDKVPVSILNFALISQLTLLARPAVEKLYYAVIDILNKKLLGGRSVLLTFNKVVELQFSQGRLTCKYLYQDYAHEYVPGSPRFKNLDVLTSPQARAVAGGSPRAAQMGLTTPRGFAPNSPRPGSASSVKNFGSSSSARNQGRLDPAAKAAIIENFRTKIVQRGGCNGIKVNILFYFILLLYLDVSYSILFHFS